jgi:eukaryotic-like serine/threonine-protein kinase
VHDPAVGDVIDQYRLTAVLARGGMATVFEALDTDTGQLVVLKIPYLHFEADLVFFERFRREEAIGQSLDHPGIVKVLRPREKSRVYLVMERVEGRSLRAVLDEGGIPRARGLEIVRALGEALAYLHAQGVVHRDLKPENIVITPDGRPKIIDLGLASSRAARRITWTGLSTTMGTPAYLAPERLGGRRGDARADVYGLGMLLYELVAGRLPYDDTDPAAVLRAKRTAPPPPSTFAAGIDPALEAIVMRCIDARPADRFASATELVAALRDPSAYRAPMGQGRDDRRSAGVRLALVALSLVLVLLIWWSMR